MAERKKYTMQPGANTKGGGGGMATAAKNFLAVGAGLALAAGGVYLLVQSATQLTAAGPGAAIAITGMAVGIGALMRCNSRGHLRLTRVHHIYVHTLLFR